MVLGAKNAEKIVKNTENIQGLVVHPVVLNLPKNYTIGSFGFPKIDDTPCCAICYLMKQYPALWGHQEVGSC